MLKDLNIPRMGSVENAKLVAWRVAEGEAYAEGDVIYEVETDKTTTEVEATESGVLARRLAASGEEFKVGDKVGLWVTAGTPAAAMQSALAELDELAAPAAVGDPPVAPPNSASVAVNGPRPVSIQATNGTRISPLARRLAAQHGIDVSKLRGSGARGKITGKDVLAAHARPVLDVAAPAPPAVAAQAQAVLDAAAPAPAATFSSPRLAPRPAAGQMTGQAEVVPHSLRRRTIARRMTEAAAVPCLTADMEVDLGPLFAYRASPDGKGASVLGTIAAAVVATLIEHPQLNAHWTDEAMLLWGEVHLGVAVDAAEGLVVPVIRNAERYSARGLTDEIAKAARRAREGELRPEDLEGGTFSLSNPGSLGPVLRAEALLNLPQVALLGLPAIIRVAKPVPDGTGWAVAVREVMRPSLTFDHRALDGGAAIAFLKSLKVRLESL